MKKTKLTIFATGTSLLASALLAAGCNTAPTNTNSVAGANSNTAVVVNSNQAPIMNSNSVTNSVSRTMNANMTREEFNRTRDDYARDARATGSTIGSGVEDAWLHSKTKLALAAENDLRDSTINVDVDNNVVTLRGSVANNNQKTRATTIARGIDGVKNVRNNLTVGGSGAMNGNTMGNSNMMRNSNAR